MLKPWRWSAHLETIYEAARNDDDCRELSDAELWDAICGEYDEEENNE